MRIGKLPLDLVADQNFGTWEHWVWVAYWRQLEEEEQRDRVTIRGLWYTAGEGGFCVLEFGFGVFLFCFVLF
jgi:hypothetical protein